MYFVESNVTLARDKKDMRGLVVPNYHFVSHRNFAKSEKMPQQKIPNWERCGLGMGIECSDSGNNKVIHFNHAFDHHNYVR